MVVLVIDAVYIFPSTGEGDAPVAAHFHGSRAFSRTAEFVEIQARQVHVLGACCNIQTAENKPKPVGVFRLNSRFGASDEESFESFVPESFDRQRIL